MERVIDVAKYICDEYQKRANCVIDELKLHKLLYFVQRETLAIHNEPMFKECFRGWKHGPVCTNVRYAFEPHNGIVVDTKTISKENAHIINNIIEQYGSVESWALSKLTHKEISWLNARKGLKDDENGNEPLLLEDIAKDAEKVRPYDSIWDMYYDEFEDGDDD